MRPSLRGARRAVMATLILPLVLAGAAPAEAADDLWLHVRVDEADGGARVRVNLPLELVRKAGTAIPVEVMRQGRMRIEDCDLSVPELRELWRELEASPDMTFVTVEEADEHVRVAKSGGYLLVKVDEGRGIGEEGERVDVRIPVRVVDALLSGEGDELDFAAALDALAAHGEGELVAVSDDGDEVRVWIDRTPETP